MKIELTQDELLLLLDNVDFCQDNKDTYDEYSIISVTSTCTRVKRKDL